MFAKYSEPPILQDNVSDTGLSLRAFLPLGTQERRRISSYVGKALVMDSRVTCQRPIIENFGFHDNHRALNGTVRPSKTTTRLDRPDLDMQPFVYRWTYGWSFC